MKVVLLFFCGILILMVCLFILVIFSKIRLNVKKCKIENIKCGKKIRGLDKEFEVFFEFYLLGFIKIFNIKITKKLLNKFKIKQDIKSLEKDAQIVKKAHPIQIIKKLKLKLESLKLNLDFGTESVMLTVYLVAIISSIVRYNCEKCRP